MPCPICFDVMDMNEFEDERASTLTCYKLECGHAYHTACVMGFLTNTNRKCPQCNSQQDQKDPITVVKTRKLVLEIKRNPDVKNALLEFKTAKESLLQKNKQLRKDVIEFAKNRCKELDFKEHVNYFKKSMSEARKLIVASSKKMGDKHFGALLISKADWDGQTFLYQTFFKFRGRWQIQRLKSPRMFIYNFI